MKDFSNIKFQGTFRNYQQRVLDASAKYLKNNKIHIVAAPGSGKTILGLELIRRQNEPCIVLSPTNTIRYQWGDRFEEMYLPKGDNIDNYISYDLNDVKLITSITYQGMHSAINKIACVDEDNNSVDYSNIDLFKLVNEFGIKTICVDEAHHLQNEWQKALEIFMGGLPKGVKVIALTATPPYDATPTEWNRYVKICGDIDEEIFVSELVKAKNLCPHQDYVYLNYPTEEESLILKKHKENIAQAFEELKTVNAFQDISKKILKLYRRDENTVFSNIQEYIAIHSLLKKLGIPFNEKEVMWYLETKEFPQNISSYETALNFLLKEDLMSDEEKTSILTILKKYKLVERNKVCIQNNSKIEKELLLSLGKMESIINIVDCESQNLKEKLRLLILTDYIRKPSLSKIGTEDLFKDISIVSIFENIRRHNGNLKLAILSGTLVVLPSNLEKDIRSLLGKNENKLSCTPLGDTNYSEYHFKTSNKEKVAVVGKIFEEGKVNIVVGTKSLLGEGWDSPCINSLIMASFVGSFMLSNQMRGRAIRTYKKDPEKTANIWHLVTLEPEDDTNTKIDCTEESSSDYKTLKRRFNCFVGPHYTEKKIESGIERISILADSYTKETVTAVNAKMVELSNDRASLADKWQVGKGSGIMYMQSIIPIDRKPKGIRNLNICQAIAFALLATILFVLPNTIESRLVDMVLIAIGIMASIQFVIALAKSICLSIYRLYIFVVCNGIKRALFKNNLLQNRGKVKVSTTKSSAKVHITLNSIKEQKVFLQAVEEFFSPIMDPRYVLCRSICKFPMYRYSYQIPSMLASNKTLATDCMKNLKCISPATLIYVKSAENKRKLHLCKKRSYLKSTSKEISQKQVN